MIYEFNRFILPLRMFTRHGDDAIGLGLSPDESMLCTGSRDYSVKVVPYMQLLMLSRDYTAFKYLNVVVTVLSRLFTIHVSLIDNEHDFLIMNVLIVVYTLRVDLGYSNSAGEEHFYRSQEYCDYLKLGERRGRRTEYCVSGEHFWGGRRGTEITQTHTYLHTHMC